jgi:hypothetical protein
MAEAGFNQARQGASAADAARLLLAAARERFAVAATDLLLPGARPPHRMAAPHPPQPCSARLVRSIEDALRAPLARHFAENEALHAALSSAHVPIALPILERAQALGDAELGTILVRRVEEHRFWKAYGQSAGEDLLFGSGPRRRCSGRREAMELVIARSPPLRSLPGAGHRPHRPPAELQHNWSG